MRDYSNMEIRIILEHESDEAIKEIEQAGWEETIEEIKETGTTNEKWNKIYSLTVDEMKRRNKKC